MYGTKDDLKKSTVSEDSYSDDTIVSVDTGNSDLDSSFDQASNKGKDIDFNCDNDKYWFINFGIIEYIFSVLVCINNFEFIK